MKKIISFLLFSILVCTLQAQIQEPVKFKSELKTLSDTEAEIVFTATIDAGWHVYSTDLGDGGPTSATFNVDKKSGLELVGSLKPVGNEHEVFDQMFEMQVRYFENTAKFVQKVKFTGGAYAIEGYLMYGACNDNEHEVFDQMFEMQVRYFENTAKFVQKVKFTGGAYAIEGYLMYGACNDSNCLPPSEVSFKYEGTAKAAAKEAPAKKEQPVKKEAAEPAAQPAPAAPAQATPAPAADKAQEVTPTEEEAAAATAQPAIASGDLWTPVIDELQSLGEENGKKDMSWVYIFFTAEEEAAAATAQPAIASGDLWTPVIDELQSLGEENGKKDMSWVYIFFTGLLGGFIALFTPCVWPIIPMTVSFFLKRTKDKKKGIRDAWTYGASIVVIYVTLGLAITLTLGASALNALSTNAIFNILFFLMLVIFAASFFGAFEISLPAKWGNAVDSKAESTTGLLSIFLMAFTLSLVSFSCTGPIIGFLLVQVSTTGSVVAPAIGMLGFAIALALPFTLFALFPSWLKSMPKSGGWMNVIKVTLGFLELAFALKFLSVADLAYGWRLLDRETFIALGGWMNVIKVTLGFLELAFALKFLSVADLAYGWRLLDRETFIALWIMIFGLLGFYLLGKIKFPHDDDDNKVGVGRFFMALISLAFAVYMVPGLWGAPLKAVSAFAPPMWTQDFNLYKNEVHAKFDDYDMGMEYVYMVPGLWGAPLKAVSAFAPPMWTQDFNLYKNEVHAKFDDYDMGMEYARKNGKPVMLDFTGYGCVNCRKMEAAVWTDSKVSDLMTNDYVLITLYVDNKTPLPEPVKIMENGKERTLRTVGDKWSYLQRVKFGANAQPFYVLLDNEGKPLNKSFVYDEDVPKYIDFLKTGLENYKNRK